MNSNETEAQQALAGSPIVSLPRPSPGVKVTEDVFGKFGDQKVMRYTLSNANDVTVQVISMGAVITSLRLPDKHGNVDDVILGFDYLGGYLSPENPYIGATVGRVANRISNASFSLDGNIYHLNANEDPNTLHGGNLGWNKLIWEPHARSDSVTFTLISPDGNEGFPGTVMAQTTYRLTDDNRLFIHMHAISSKPTPINMLNHAYFNLAGHDAGPQGVYSTRVCVNADRYTVSDHRNAPTGEIRNVDGTPLDLRAPRLLGDLLLAPEFSIDTGFVINHGSERPDDLVFMARAHHQPSGRKLEVYADQPAMHLCTSDKIPDLRGKNGALYTKYCAFTFEPMNLGNAVNHRKFPNTVLRPGGYYRHNMYFKFSRE